MYISFLTLVNPKFKIIRQLILLPGFGIMRWDLTLKFLNTHHTNLKIKKIKI